MKPACQWPRPALPGWRPAGRRRRTPARQPGSTKRNASLTTSKPSQPATSGPASTFPIQNVKLLKVKRKAALSNKAFFFGSTSLCTGNAGKHTWISAFHFVQCSGKLPKAVRLKTSPSQWEIANRDFKKAHRIYIVSARCQCHCPPPAPCLRKAAQCQLGVN